MAYMIILEVVRIMISEKYRVWQLVQTRREDRAIQAEMSVFKSALVTLNIPGGIYVQWPSLVTTTFVGYVPSNFSSALQIVFVIVIIVILFSIFHIIYSLLTYFKW